MISLMTRVIYIFVAFAIVTAIGFSIPALVQNSTTAAAAEVRCPCQLKEYFKLQTKFAKAFGIFDPDLLECIDTDGAGGSTLLGAVQLADGSGCKYAITARANQGRPDLGNTCRAGVFIEEGWELFGMTCPFNVSLSFILISDDELDACREEILGVARSFQIVPCVL